MLSQQASFSISHVMGIRMILGVQEHHRSRIQL